METSAVPPAATSTPASANSATRSGGPALSSDFETFLLMLTTQLENQDPLNPQEANDFAVDLATFSTVEQQVLTNDLLERMVAAQGIGGLGGVADWIGKEARAPVPANFDGRPVTVYPTVPADADQATLIVRDSAGSVVSSVAIVASEAPVEWDGTDALGTPVDPGRYSFEVETRAEGAFLSLEPAEVYAPVTEARLDDGEPVLVIGGVDVPASQVRALRLPGTP